MSLGTPAAVNGLQEEDPLVSQTPLVSSPLWSFVPQGAGGQLRRSPLKEECVCQELGRCVGIDLATSGTLKTEMAVPPEPFVTPASRLNSFVAHCLHPSQKWKKEVLETVQTVEQFLREQSFQGEHGLDQESGVLKVVKVRLVPSIPRPGLGKMQLVGLHP